MVVSVKELTPAENILNMLAMTCHQMSKSKGFWEMEEIVMNSYPEMIPVIMGSKLALIHSEVSEVLEELLLEIPSMSKKIPDFTAEADECADIIIRVLDYCGKRNIPIGGAVRAKILYNGGRPHKHGKTM